MTLIPKTLTVRALLVLIAGIAASHSLSMGFFLFERNKSIISSGQTHISGHVVSIYSLVEKASTSERIEIVGLAENTNFHTEISRNSALESVFDQQNLRTNSILSSHLLDKGISEFQVLYQRISQIPYWTNHLQKEHGNLQNTFMQFISIKLPDDSWLNVAAAPGPLNTIWSTKFVISLLIMMVLVTILAIPIIFWLMKPIKQFSEAAHRIGTNVQSFQNISEAGPLEIHAAALAFNKMQNRIARFIEDRTQMIAAISHDLATPITRLRLRAELIEDKEQRSKIISDLQYMENMVKGIISFAKEQTEVEHQQTVELGALICRVCDDMLDSGLTVLLDIGSSSVSYECRPVALRRALSNLIQNACKYGDLAKVSLLVSQEEIFIRVDDEGSGIRTEHLQDVFKPFWRIENSRNPETGGVGLGLSVTRTIIKAHGGNLTLANLEEGGLRAEITLPR